MRGQRRVARVTRGKAGGSQMEDLLGPQTAAPKLSLREPKQSLLFSLRWQEKPVALRTTTAGRSDKSTNAD